MAPNLPSSKFFDVVHPDIRGRFVGESVRARVCEPECSHGHTHAHAHSPEKGLSNVPYMADRGISGNADPKLKLIGELFGIAELVDRPVAETYKAKSGAVWDVSLPSLERPHAYVMAEIRPASVKLRVESPEARRHRFLNVGAHSKKSLPDEVRLGFAPDSYNDLTAFCHDLTRVISASDLEVKSGGRGVITEFSEKSQTRLKSACADLQELGIKPGFMFTLTYPGAWQDAVPDGKTAKRHLQAMRKRLSRYLKREGFGDWSALWFTEFQKRGAPHFHIIGWGLMLKYADMRRIRRWSLDAWADIIAHPDPVHRLRGRKAGTKFEKMRAEHFGYAATYAKKMKQKVVPDGYKDVGRFWGFWNYRFPPPVLRSFEVSKADCRWLGGNLFSIILQHSEYFGQRLFKYLAADKPNSSMTAFGKEASEFVTSFSGAPPGASVSLKGGRGCISYEWNTETSAT